MSETTSHQAEGIRPGQLLSIDTESYGRRGNPMFFGIDLGIGKDRTAFSLRSLFRPLELLDAETLSLFNVFQYASNGADPDEAVIYRDSFKALGVEIGMKLKALHDRREREALEKQYDIELSNFEHECELYVQHHLPTTIGRTDQKATFPERIEVAKKELEQIFKSLNRAPENPFAEVPKTEAEHAAELEAEGAAGTDAAVKVVQHLQRMGAENCELIVTVEGENFLVRVSRPVDPKRGVYEIDPANPTNERPGIEG